MSPLARSDPKPRTKEKTRVAKESANVIVLDDNFLTIATVTKWGRFVLKFLQFLLTVYIVAIMINFISTGLSGSAAVTAGLLLWLSRIMDTLCALALATDLPHGGLMKRRPVGRTESFLTMAVRRNIIGHTIYQLSVLSVLYFFGEQVLGLGGTAVAITVVAVLEGPPLGFILFLAVSIKEDMNYRALVESCSSWFEEVSAVTRDGTNDAPALHEADIGLAMGIAGTQVSRIARWGCSVCINILKFVPSQLTVYIVALVINFISACVSGSAPLTAVQLLWLNLIIILTLCALALATEPPHDGLIKRRPVRRMGPLAAVQLLCLDLIINTLCAIVLDPPVWMTESFIPMAKWRNIIGQSIYQLSVLVLHFLGEQILGLRGVVVTIIVVAVPGLPLAVTLSLAFAVKKLMNDHALVGQTANFCQVYMLAGSRQAPVNGIQFSEAEAAMVLHNDPLVVTLLIMGIKVHRIMVDTGSYANIIYLNTFRRMGIGLEFVRECNDEIFGFTGNSIKAIGEINMIVEMGESPCQRTLVTPFKIVDIPSMYNAIVGRPLLSATEAYVCIRHFWIMFPTPQGNGVVRGDQRSAQECELKIRPLEINMLGPESLS